MRTMLYATNLFGTSSSDRHTVDKLLVQHPYKSPVECKRQCDAATANQAMILFTNLPAKPANGSSE